MPNGSDVHASSAGPLVRRKAAGLTKTPIATSISPDRTGSRHCHVRELSCTGRRALPLDSDVRITNYGGGNTSARDWQADLLTGERTLVLWEKGSDGKVRSMKLDGFAALHVDRLPTLEKL